MALPLAFLGVIFLEELEGYETHWKGWQFDQQEHEAAFNESAHEST